MEWVIGGAVAVLVGLTVWMVVAVLTAPYYCEKHQRFHHEAVCPDCEKEVGMVDGRQ